MGSRKIPLLMTTYDRGWMEEIVANNRFDIALKPLADYKILQAKIAETLQSGNKSLFY